jgi:hypothetical protein
MDDDLVGRPEITVARTTEEAEVVRYTLLGADGTQIASASPGLLGGNRRLKIYGRLNCPSAVRALSRGYARHRVFFADERAAIAAGYRPCGTCMREAYRRWRSASSAGVPDGA